MRDLASDSPIVLCLIVAFFSAFSSLLPLSPAEPVLIGVAAIAPTWLLLPLFLCSIASHMSTKVIVFLGGRKVESAFRGRSRAAFERARDRLAGRPRLQCSALFFSSVTGLPPFYLATAVCGTLKMPLRHFLLFAGTGRSIRFAAMIFIPQLLRPAPLSAQAVVSRQPPAITIRGQGAETYVLLSGMVGGVAGFQRLEDQLVARGNRVVRVDPYQLSINESDVSFDAMARRVNTLLDERGIGPVHLVGHAHGGGVALRLAALPSTRAMEVVLLDVGAQTSNRGAVFSSSLRLVPMITRLPFGREFVRRKFIAGVRENSGGTGWLDAATQRAYAEPMLDNIDRVIALALRLGKADEPEVVENVIARIHVPVTVLLGSIRGPASSTPEEMNHLRPLGSLLRVHMIPGAGHFLHEECPGEVASYLHSSSVMFVGNETPSGR